MSGAQPPGKLPDTAPPPRTGLASLHPAYFALVMASGIVSIAASLLISVTIARVLLVFNLAAYPTIWALTLVRVVRYPSQVVADLAHHGRAVGFFTTVAATSVLGSQCLVVAGAARAAFALWIAGIVLWAVLTYTIFTILTVKRQKPSLAEGLNGGWLLVVVASQSVAVLGAQLLPGWELASREAAAVFCLAMWLGGGMLYIWIIGLIFYRYTFFSMSPSDLAPPYWINMGAAAISALAGANLALAAPSSVTIRELLPFVRGLALMWWATASWWIPMLISLGVWRHIFSKFPLRYDPLYWGAVFPLGMYTVATVRISAALDVARLSAIARPFVYVALGAWCLVAVGLGGDLVGRLKLSIGRPPDATGPRAK
jgi:tellurite resistance protein TehA-like permease